MKFPCEYYLKHLLATQAPGPVAEHIQRYGYPQPEEAYLAKLRAEVYKTRPVPYIPKSRKVRSWRRRLKISSAHVKSPQMVKAERWTRSTIIRTALEMLLIAGLPAPQVAENMTLLSGTTFEIETVQLYTHYFWNRDVMTYGEWQTFLEHYPNGRELRYLYTVDPAVALWKTGVLPDLDDSAALDRLQGDSYMRMQELNAHPNTLKTAMTASYWSGIYYKTKEEKRQGAHALTKILHHMHEMSLLLRKGKIPDGTHVLDDAQILQIPERTS